MPTAPLRSVTPTIDVYVKLAQYPIMSDRIRLRMREELFRRGVISQQKFEKEVKEMAVESQQREGLRDPSNQEDEATWQKRVEIVREMHTDMYFANNLGSALLDQLIEETLRNDETPDKATDLNFNPEIAPWALLFSQGEIYDALPPPEKEKIKHHLQEIKVVLIKRLMSDQLPFIAIARDVFTISDLRWVYDRMIGGGKIGGKASGMMLAWKILAKNEPDWGPHIQQQVAIPETFFIGSEIIYEFIYHNKLTRFLNQKYLSKEEMEQQYPAIVKAHLAAELPDITVEQLRETLERLDGRPFIVRSSSLLEDHIDYSFAGQYRSYFCPNQRDPETNLAALKEAIKRVYASTFNPRAMAERQKHGLIDYDERMAIMIQPLVGHVYGRYFLPTVIGTGRSDTPWHKNTAMQVEDGCLRLVWGLAGRIVDPLNTQQSSIIMLSHPQKRPELTEGTPYSQTQREVRLIDLDANEQKTVPVKKILKPDYPFLEYVATPDPDISDSYHITFDYLAQDPKFVKLMRSALMRLKKVYQKPVVVEFTVDIIPTRTGVDYKLYILQCHTSD
ncbi:MAG TPA: hypothetical protein ENK32_06530 [Anaerolineae bacterium]|nr:hypothetical protein [Anaerolineae bacterium]